MVSPELRAAFAKKASRNFMSHQPESVFGRTGGQGKRDRSAIGNIGKQGSHLT